MQKYHLLAMISLVCRLISADIPLKIDRDALALDMQKDASLKLSLALSCSHVLSG